MPVKRRASKERPWRITAEAVEAFQTAMQTRAVRDACVRSIACQSEAIGKHCGTCATNIEAEARLGRLLGVRLWEASPTHADGDVPPDWYREGQRESWARVREMRTDLERAAKARHLASQGR